MAVRGDLCRVLAMISWSGTCWSPRWATAEWRSWCSRGPRSGPGTAPAPGTHRPQVRTTLAAAALARFGVADGAGAVLTGTVPTTLPESNVVTLSAVDGGANAIPLGLPAGPN
jgi:hypothetical protein